MSESDHSNLPCKSGKHSITFRLETRTREDLFGLGTVLADILPPPLLQDEKKPFLVCVNGDEMSGKKIIPDSIKDRLLGFNARMTGNREFDERWFGRYKKKSIEIDFMNAGWDTGFSDQALSKAGSCMEMIDHFCQGRKHPGIAFIHNCCNTFKAAADISIELRIPALANIFRDIAEDWDPEKEKSAIDEMKSWKRSLQISINNSQLVQHPDFMAACESLSERIAAVRPGKLKTAENAVTRRIDDARRNLSLFKYDVKKFMRNFY